MKATRSTYQPIRTIRSIWGARSVAMVGNGGGSTEESGSLVRSSLRRPGTAMSATTSTMNGSEVKSAEDHTLSTGR